MAGGSQLVEFLWYTLTSLSFPRPANCFGLVPVSSFSTLFSTIHDLRSVGRSCHRSLLFYRSTFLCNCSGTLCDRYTIFTSIQTALFPMGKGLDNVLLYHRQIRKVTATQTAVEPSNTSTPNATPIPIAPPITAATSRSVKVLGACSSDAL